MKKLIMVISLASIVSCSIPTIPKFPEISCKPIEKLSVEQLAKLKEVCGKDVIICPIDRKTFMQIFSNYQNKAACLDQYQETSKIYR